MTCHVSALINGGQTDRDIDPRLSLGDFLRDDCGLTGTHLACEHGVCGACTVLVDGATGKARGVAFVDSVTKRSLEAKGKVVILAASTLESARLMLLSKSPRYPNGIGNSSGHVGHNFCEHVMGQ